MTSLRDDRYAAARAWHRRLAEDFEAFAPGFLDALEVIDGKHAAAGPKVVLHVDGIGPVNPSAPLPPSPGRGQARPAMTGPVPVSTEPPKAVPASGRPATRRRTRT